MRTAITLSALALMTVLGDLHAESTCFGTPGNGRIEAAVQLPDHGINFSAYSSLGTRLGRTYVHSTVREIIVAAYKALEISAPDKNFVYGESGWKSGGKFRPHRTHQNGTSVDFFVPVIDERARSVPLPTNPLNKFGYGIDFDSNGRFENYAIDFEALGEHLYQLDIASRRAGTSMTLVIFDPPYLPKLFSTKHGEFLRKNLKFMKGNAWVRHDEHYHVNFAIRCKPLPQ